MNLVDKKQDLLGYRTLNLLNSHTDPSFLRTVLYNHIARHYLPAPEANLVRVVINGESWGVYVNEEQFNKDFVEKWFGNGDGPRWKVPPDFSGAAALVYHGDNVDDYRGRYEIKAKNEEQAWRDLIELCKILKETPDDRLEEELGKVLDIDRALWFLALDNVLIDEDGYYSRGSDYSLYQDPKDKRFHILPRDSNETFRFDGGGPGFGGRGGPGGGRGFRGGPGGDRPPGEGAPPTDRGGGPREPEAHGATRDPLAQLDAENRPLVRRLLSNERLKARYLAKVRTIVDEWLDWEKLGPVFEDYRALIADDVMRDTRNLATFADFFDADIAGAAGGGPFGGPPGLKRWVEDRRAYLLKHPELSKVASQRRATPTASTPPAVPLGPPTVALNELMAANNRTIKDPQGKFADWIELVNTGHEEVDLSGLYLTDDKSKPRKWKFPKGTKLAAAEHLIVWADEGGKSAAGLHANFKLSKSGETVLLLDQDDRGNTLIDTVEFGEQRADIAFGRYPDGRGKWQLLPPTPGRANVAE
jgi:hypothetical protein